MSIFNNLSLTAGIGGILLVMMSGTAFSAPGDAALGNGLFARITTTGGDIVVRLEYQKTPLTVCNFVALTEGKMDFTKNKPFYDGLIFHRVIADFMIQGGDPAGNGTGGPPYKFADEFDPGLKHDGPGVLSMANAGPGTNGSQFFITLAPTPHLNGRHTVFGKVVEGIDILQSIGRVKTDSNDRPLERVVINKVTIIRNGPEAAAFKADQAAFDNLLRNAGASAAAKLRAQRDADIAQINAKYPNTRETASGIRYIIQKEGTGAKPAAGKTVRVNVKGMLLNGMVFADTILRNRPLEFQAGTSKVLRGQDEMILDMKVGEKRLAIIPPELAYGNQAVGNGIIPANSFLVFEMELVGIR
ncbi:peptidylprolyl isomerase [Spirochaetia bacterium]|nr:peptidylprolyl isomerase [Spirochaetia bacterium]